MKVSLSILLKKNVEKMPVFWLTTISLKKHEL